VDPSAALTKTQYMSGEIRKVLKQFDGGKTFQRRTAVQAASNSRPREPEPKWPEPKWPKVQKSKVGGPRGNACGLRTRIPVLDRAFDAPQSDPGFRKDARVASLHHGLGASAISVRKRRKTLLTE
jgi:hypothetical protein